MSYWTVTGHRSMALDHVRNAAYAEALREVIGPETVVLDLGAGVGIHGLIAARLGARRVYLVEPEDVVYVAETIAAANGLADRVCCVQGRIQDVDLPERVDVIVSAMTGNFLVSEDLLPAVYHAREQALKPGGVLIPSAAAMQAVPVSAPEIFEREIAGWSRLEQDVDLSAGREYAANAVMYGLEGSRSATFLAEPETLATVDFSVAHYQRLQTTAEYEITEDGVCHGWLGWIRLKLGQQWLSASPRDPQLHWSTAFLPADPPLPFTRGDHVTFTLDRPPYGDWAWTIESRHGRQRHSTFRALALGPLTLAKAGSDYTPGLNRDGEVLQFTLGSFNGSDQVGAIAQRVMAAYPNHFSDSDEALAFVRRLVKTCGS